MLAEVLVCQRLLPFPERPLASSRCAAANEQPVLFSREHYVPTVFNLSVRRVRRRGPS